MSGYIDAKSVSSFKNTNHPEGVLNKKGGFYEYAKKDAIQSIEISLMSLMPKFVPKSQTKQIEQILKYTESAGI